MILANFKCDNPSEMLSLLLDLEDKLDYWGNVTKFSTWKSTVYMTKKNKFLIEVSLNVKQNGTDNNTKIR